MEKIAVLYIALGKYDIFWNDFYESSEKYFLTELRKEYFVFTDSQAILAHSSDTIHVIEQRDMGWPDNTLRRFELFDRISEQLQSFDYVYFFNANMEFVDVVGREFLPDKEELVVARHPGYENANNRLFPYCRDKKSTAYIPKGVGRYYVQGCLNGGRAAAYLEMVNELSKQVQIDLDNGIIAVWHDESHLNAYVNRYPNSKVKVLELPYLYPESIMCREVHARIIQRDKNRYFKLAENRSNASMETIHAKVLRRISKLSVFVDKHWNKFQRIPLKIYIWTHQKENILIRQIAYAGKKIKLTVDKNSRLITDCGVQLQDGIQIRAVEGSEITLQREVNCCQKTVLESFWGGRLSIGSAVYLGPECRIICAEKITIEDGAVFGPRVMIYDHDHAYDRKPPRIWSYYRTAPVRIGSGSWIGAGSTILKGSTIGKNCVIAAGSIVSGSVPDNTIYCNPRERKVRQFEYVDE